MNNIIIINIIHLIGEGITLSWNREREFIIEIKEKETRCKIIDQFIQDSDRARKDTFVCGIQGLKVTELLKYDRVSDIIT